VIDFKNLLEARFLLENWKNFSLEGTMSGNEEKRERFDNFEFITAILIFPFRPRCFSCF
jgi:hypothetical protein